MAEMALKSVKIRNMSQLQAAYDTILQENNVKAKTCSRKAIKKLIQAEIEDVEFPTTDQSLDTDVFVLAVRRYLEL